MAEALAILGLVSGIITFVDFGSKVVSGAKQIRNSGDGMLDEVKELEQIVEDVRRFNSEAKKQLGRGVKTSDEMTYITNMVEDCENICKELCELMQNLAIRNSSMLESGRVAIRAVLKRKAVRRLRQRLEKMDERIRKHIQNAFKDDRHDTILSRLKEIERAQQAHGVEQSSRLNSAREDIMRLTSQMKFFEDSHSAMTASFVTRYTDMTTSLVTKFESLRNEYSAALRHTEVLKSLYFPEYRRRHDQIPEAEERTNGWIYDPEETAFAAWLASTKQDDGLFYIFGKAGSGKSTLMKHISKSPDTEQHLNNWTGSHQLFISSFYFWNQGSEMQKTELGLFQSLLYQILKVAPQFAPKTRLDHEAWDMKSLKAAFELIVQDSESNIKHCFFIDGLDEYEGDEWDVVGMLKTLSSSGNIKICASSRPGRIYERFVYEKILSTDRMIDIAEFTKTDMKTYVDTRLHKSEMFRKMAYPMQLGNNMHPICDEIISDITNWADGVWLWVFLVTRDIIKQVERDESVTQLRRVVDEFPADLEQYFERIIERIDDMHKDEMAQIFLVTMDELQPLPLYAFHLLERERDNPHYAVQEVLRPVDEQDLSPRYEQWKARVRNRCGDLVTVDAQPHPVFLSHSVDFLHRTVRDFLRNCYQHQLRCHLKKEFDPSASLCKIYLCFLKGLPEDATINAIIGLTDELLYYAHEVERNSDKQDKSPLIAVLNEVDRVNSSFGMTSKNHWTHARDLPKPENMDRYYEGSQCNFLALTVQARLYKYVRAQLKARPSRLQKGGRPLLDYALRPLRVTPIRMPYHSDRDDPNVDVDMVELLLKHGANPNQRVYLNDGESVWGLFLISIYSSRAEAVESLRKAWFRSCLALIQGGARGDYTFVHESFENMDVSAVINAVFRSGEVEILQTRMDECIAMQETPSWSCRIM